MGCDLVLRCGCFSFVVILRFRLVVWLFTWMWLWLFILRLGCCWGVVLGVGLGFVCLCGLWVIIEYLFNLVMLFIYCGLSSLFVVAWVCCFGGVYNVCGWLLGRCLFTWIRFCWCLGI